MIGSFITKTFSGAGWKTWREGHYSKFLGLSLRSLACRAAALCLKSPKERQIFLSAFLWDLQVTSLHRPAAASFCDYLASKISLATWLHYWKMEKKHFLALGGAAAPPSISNNLTNWWHDQNFELRGHWCCYYTTGHKPTKSNSEKCILCESSS